MEHTPACNRLRDCWNSRARTTRFQAAGVNGFENAARGNCPDHVVNNVSTGGRGDLWLMVVVGAGAIRLQAN